MGTKTPKTIQWANDAAICDQIHKLTIFLANFSRKCE